MVPVWFRAVCSSTVVPSPMSSAPTPLTLGGHLSDDKVRILLYVRERIDADRRGLVLDDEKEFDRLDKLQASVWNQALNGDVAAVSVVLKVIDQRVRLLGLQAPRRRGSGELKLLVIGEGYAEEATAQGTNGRCHRPTGKQLAAREAVEQ